MSLYFYRSLMFNDLYSYVPEPWKIHIKRSDLDPIIRKLNKQDPRDVLPWKYSIFEPLKYIDPDDVRVVILGEPTTIKELSTGIPYSIPIDYRFTDIAKRIPNPPVRSKVIAYLSNVTDTNDATLRDCIRKGILLLNYPLTCSDKQKYAHVNYGWETLVTNLLERLLYRSDKQLLLVAWNYYAYKLYNNLNFVWIPDIHNQIYKSPVHSNLRMIISSGPDKNTTITEQSKEHDKYKLLSSRYEFDDEDLMKFISAFQR